MTTLKDWKINNDVIHRFEHTQWYISAFAYDCDGQLSRIKIERSTIFGRKTRWVEPTDLSIIKD